MATQFSPQEVHFLEDGQTIISIEHAYVVGGNELVVFLNGMLAVVNQDYTETDEHTITFAYQLSKEDIVVTQHNVYFDDILVQVIGKTGNSLFQKYGELERLMKNQEYTFTFNYGEQTFKGSFYTQMDPVYSTPAIVRSDLGELLQSIKDYTIWFQIYQNSILAYNLVPEDNRRDVFEQETGIPYYVKQYVRYRTELDFIISFFLSLSGKPSSDHKVLGALEIERRFRLEDIRPLMAEIKAKLRPWEDLVKGSGARRSPLMSAVRGGTQFPYPLHSPRRGGS